MKNYFIATVAASAIMMGSALAQNVTIPTAPAATNSGQNAAVPVDAGGAMTTGSEVGGTMLPGNDGDSTNSVPTSPQAENGGQNSADPASSAAMGTTVGGAGFVEAGQTGSVPTSPASENDGQQSVDQNQSGGMTGFSTDATASASMGDTSATDIAGSTSAAATTPIAENDGQDSADPAN